jgi:RND family efflux transporter MFP subunit
MRAIRFLLAVMALALIFVFGFGYGRWYSTRPAEVKSARRILYYVDPMHPWYKSNKPGIAPDCGMQLVPVYADGTQGVAEAVPAGAVQVAPDKQQLIGVRYGEAEWISAAQTIHAAGRVVPDETLITRVQARAEGWITDVSADFTGQFIEKGQTMLMLYSPELLTAQQEYLLALKARTIMQHSSMREATANNDALAEAARRRLLLLNLTPEQIAAIEDTQKPIPSVAIYAPAKGYVMTRNAYLGQRVTTETELYTLADLSHVWVMADVFETDAPQIRMGQAARVLVQGEAGSIFARVTYIQPQIDPATRTMKVRLELANPKMRLKPDMFVDVEMDLGGARRLSVPAEAVTDTGATKTVFLDRGNGYFEPRQVETGERFADRIEIVQGLKPGERIVTSGTFLLNSETQMKQASGAMPDMPDMPDMPGMSGGKK